MEEFLFRIGIFGFIVIALIVLFLRIMESDFETGPKHWFKSFFISFSSTGLLFSYLFHIFPGKDVFTFSPLVQNLFASNAAFFWWLFLPLIGLFLSRNH